MGQFDDILTKEFLFENLINQGVSQTKLALNVGCSIVTINNYCKKYNLIGIYPKVKYCYKCKITKPLDKFRKHKSEHRKNSPLTYCIACSSLLAREYRKNEVNKKRMAEATKKWQSAHPERSKINAFKRLTGLSEREYQALDKKCAICNSNLFLVLDHCHKTNKFRSLLCSSCNKGLGFFRDNPDLLHKASVYISKWKIENGC